LRIYYNKEKTELFLRGIYDEDNMMSLTNLSMRAKEINVL